MTRNWMRTWALTFVTVVSLAGCGGGGGGDETPPVAGGSPPATPAPPAPPPAATGTLTVRVVDVLGFAKPGATLELVGATRAPATTGADGTAQLVLPAGTDQLIQVSLPGHTQQFRPARVANGQTGFLVAKLMARAPVLTLPDAAAGGTLVGHNAARLILPANALVDAQTAAPVTGAVQVEMTPVNTASHEIGAFPGTMRAVSGSTQGQLATYGPVEYIFTQNGRRLALAQGQTAEIEMPLHARVNVNGVPLAVGETMPVWSLNESTGVWHQEGEGTIVGSRSATGLALRATVTHFSWWNPDHFDDPVTVNISFSFDNNVVPTDCCNVEASTTFGYEGPAGIANTTLPPAGGTVIVNGGSVYLFGANGLSAAGPVGGALDRSIPEGIGSVSLTIPMNVNPNQLLPTITSPAAGAKTYTNATLTVFASVSGGPPDLVELRADNINLGPMSGSPETGYSFSWDTSGFNETTYDLVVRARRNNTVVSSTSRTVVVDRTPPAIVTLFPTPNAADVDPAAVGRATFNEPIDPDSLVNAAAPTVRLVVGTDPAGTALPVALTLSEDGRTVTATPAAPLATGTVYTVFAQGLTDLAGNAMAPGQWTFLVPLWALGSPDLRSQGPDGNFEGNVIGRPEIDLASSGEPLVLWRQGTSNGSFTLQAARRIGAAWVPLPPLLPLLPANSAFGDQSMALDGTGQPVVAWTQTTANGTGCNTTQPSQLFVSRFNGTAWQTLGGGSLNVNACSQPSLPRLKMDAQGRAVVVSAQGNGGLTIQVRRFEGNDWVLMGAVPVQTVPSLPFPVTELRLALQGNVPYVLRTENRSGSLGHFVSRLEGGAFVPVGPQLATGNRDTRAALVFDPQGQPLAVVQAGTSGLRVLRFDGGSWQVLGGSVTTSVFMNEPSLVFESGVPVVAWRDGSAQLRRFDPAAGDWAGPRVLRENVGSLAEMKRRPEGGPVWTALTTGPNRRELRATTAPVIP